MTRERLIIMTTHALDQARALLLNPHDPDREEVLAALAKLAPILDREAMRHDADPLYRLAAELGSLLRATQEKP